MHPSAVHSFFGYGFKVSTFGGAIIVAIWVAANCDGFNHWTAIAILVALPLGWVLGAFILWPFVFALGRRFNGAPWSTGDSVQILIGRNRGHVGPVYETWPSRGQVRVDISDVGKNDFTDVFHDNEVFRVRAFGGTRLDDPASGRLALVQTN